MMQPMNLNDEELIQTIKSLLHQARTNVYQTVNAVMTQTYWQIGQHIVEVEQAGHDKAKYGQQLIKTLSDALNAEFGKGFSVDNLENMRRFYLAFPPTHDKSETVSRKFSLSWSHYIFLSRIDQIAERHFYEIEATQNRWTLRELKRQFNSGLYERLQLSTDKEKVRQLATQGQMIENPQDLIKDPYILEFVGLPIHSSYSESQLEQKLIDKLESFLLELGKGFTFVARQKRLTIDEKHFSVDLVFYNRLLKCFVLIDLKIGELTHENIGQMMMYVNYFDRTERLTEENPTVGIILCKDKSNALVEMTLPQNQTQIFVSKYLNVLPDKEQLKKLLAD